MTATAAAAALPNGGVVYLPAGNYPFLTSPVLNNIKGVTFQGDGYNATALIMGASGVNIFSFTGSCDRCRVRDMWIGSFFARASGAGISIVGSAGLHTGEIMIERVTIQNVPAPFFVQYADKIDIVGLQFIQSIASATTGVVLYMDTSIVVTMERVTAYTTAGTFPNNVVQIDHDCDTIVMKNCVLLNGAADGVAVLKSSGTTGPRLVRFNSVYVESMVGNGFQQSEGQSVHYTDCHAAVNGGTGFSVVGGKAIKFRGCFSLQNGLQGFLINGAGINRCSLIDCTATNNSQLTHNTYDGIRIEDNTTHVTVAFCTLGDFYNTPVNKQRYGLSIGSIGTDYITAWGNDYVGNQTAGLGDFSTGSHNLILDTQTVKRLAGRKMGLTDAATIANVDPRLATVFSVTLGGNRTMGVPLDGANWVPGQRITFFITQDGTGGRTLAWHGAYVQKWTDVGNVAGATSTISFVAGDDGFWYQDGAQKPYQGAAPLDSDGDVVASGGFRQTPDGWYQDNIVASQTNIELTRATGRFRTARAGSVTGVVVHAVEARTAGTLTIKVFKNTGLSGAAGSQLGTLTAVLDGSNTSKKATTQAKDVDTFAAGDELYLTITTDGSWTPTTSDVRAALEIED
jgi:hypothetical protein